MTELGHKKHIPVVSGEGKRGSEGPKDGLNILYLEDVTVLNAITMRAVKTHEPGLDITGVKTGKEAMDLITKREKEGELPFTAGFLDVDVPGGSGTDIARRMHDLNPDVFIVFMTGREPNDPVFLPLVERDIHFSVMLKNYGVEDVIRQVGNARIALNQHTKAS